MLRTLAEQTFRNVSRKLGMPLIREIAIVDEIVALYDEKHRFYHTSEHVVDCLVQLEKVSEIVKAPEVLALALLYHDVIYNPKASDNEEKSARLASTHVIELFGRADAVPTLSNRLQELILLTKHGKMHPPPDDEDAQCLVDIDLSILGRDPEVYATYDKNIRREYEFVPDSDYRVGRTKVLQGFLNEPYIYHTKVFRDRYEEKARWNIRHSIARLANPTIPLL